MTLHQKLIKGYLLTSLGKNSICYRIFLTVNIRTLAK